MMDVKLARWRLEDRERLKYVVSNVQKDFLSDRLYGYTLEDAGNWIGMVMEHDEKDGIFRAIVVEGEIIGSISLRKKSDVYMKDAEIGYFLLTEKWSKGIMTESVKQICDIGFKTMDIVRITGMVHEPNTASRKVLEKNGFVLEGIMKDAVFKNREFVNLCIYGKYKMK